MFTFVMEQEVEGYAIGGVIGAGAFGEVRLGKSLKRREFMAVKVIDPSRIKNENHISIEKECKFMNELNHANIMPVIEILRDVKFKGRFCKKCGCTNFVHSMLNHGCGTCGSHTKHSHGPTETRRVTIIVQPLAIGGELYGILELTGSFSENISRYYFKQLIQAVKACHDKDIAHRDIKPENIVLDNNLNLKLIDFGLAVRTSPSKMLHEVVGSTLYAAPEIYDKSPYDGKLADLWSCAIVLFIMLTGRPPFRRPIWPGKNDEKGCSHFAALMRGRFPQRLSRSARDLLSKLFQEKPNARISLDAVLKHPWMQQTMLEQETVQIFMRNKVSTFWKCKRKYVMHKLLSSKERESTDVHEYENITQIVSTCTL